MGVKSNKPQAIVRTQLQTIGDEISTFLVQNANFTIRMTEDPPARPGSGRDVYYLSAALVSRSLVWLRVAFTVLSK